MTDTQSNTQTGAADGTSMNVTFNTDGPETAYIYVDDNAGGVPASYDVEYETHAGSGNYMTHYEATGSTAYSHEVPATGTDGRVTVTNASGTSADHRVRVVYE